MNKMMIILTTVSAYGKNWTQDPIKATEEYQKQ